MIPEAAEAGTSPALCGACEPDQGPACGDMASLPRLQTEQILAFGQPPSRDFRFLGFATLPSPSQAASLQSSTWQDLSPLHLPANMAGQSQDTCWPFVAFSSLLSSLANLAVWAGGPGPRNLHWGFCPTALSIPPTSDSWALLPAFWEPFVLMMG